LLLVKRRWRRELRLAPERNQRNQNYENKIIMNQTD
jgi:hypothetical protein